MPLTAADVRETIEVLLVELRGVAQPHEMALLHELALDAEDEPSPEQVEKIAKEVESLRVFCMNRAMSAEAMRLDLPRRR